ncbi:MAG: hypothetical protein II821_08125 [Treponema sp.]|nr:hypothetical protein [Treponema sp.]
MKKIWKSLAVIAALSMLFSFASCSDSDDNGSSVDTTSNSSVSELTVSEETVTLGPKGEKVITVTALGTFLATSDNELLTATPSQSAKTVTLKAADTISERTTVNVKVYLKSDPTVSKTIVVTLDPEVIDAYELTLTLDETVAASAASITVYAEGKEDSESSAALYQTVTAEYTAGETTAVAKLDKAKANSWKYFNNIVVTVKDSSDNEIDVEFTPVYFDYSDESFTGITVSAATSSKTFTINFDGFTIAGGSVEGLKYSTVWAETSSGWAADTTFTPTVTVSDDGTKATFSVENTNAFYIDWTQIVVKNSDGNEQTISSGNTEANKWYSYAGDIWSNTLTYVDQSGLTLTLIASGELTITKEGTYQYAVSYDAIKDYDSVYITLAEITAYGSGSYSKPCLGTKTSSEDDATWSADTVWQGNGAFTDSNVGGETGGYFAEITPSDYENGVYITGKTGLAGTLYVTGVKSN